MKSANAADDVASSRMSYSRFLEYLDMGRVKKVDSLRDRGTIGIVEAVSPELGNRVQRVRVRNFRARPRNCSRSSVRRTLTSPRTTTRAKTTVKSS